MSMLVGCVEWGVGVANSAAPSLKVHPCKMTMAKTLLRLFFRTSIYLVQATMTDSSHEESIPLLSPFGTYPNPLVITESDRAKHLHPVVVFATKPLIMDFTKPSNERHLAMEEERLERSKQYSMSLLPEQNQTAASIFAIGRYDENRVNMYTSPMFDDVNHDIDGYAGRRTIHVGIDLGGPVGTPVYSCCDGTVHSAGYNGELGDYGYVLVVEHCIQREHGSSDIVFYALYGHLDGSVKQWNTGDVVKAGQVLAKIGDYHENGGWLAPHVHFQIATTAPETHDMPGAVCVNDRRQALIDYPDPRYILGELY
ncbi:hypothetical protein MPSEU_000029500 [Mayamaea pseudoterrestris]|nr:hypothetical protein MPSEU_000029500 [Mayamaea pseudoterrestris]